MHVTLLTPPEPYRVTTYRERELASDHIHTIMMVKLYSGTWWIKSLPTFVLQVRKNPEKTLPRKLVPTGDRTRALCVTGAHAAVCPTAVDYATPMDQEL